jgi:Flp pilus assembly protein TadG
MMNRYLEASVRNRGLSDRTGAACVETAVCLPVLLILVLGAVEVTNKIFLKQSMATAAYESCRAAIRTEATMAEALSAGEAILKSRGVKSFTFNFQPADVSTAKRGDTIRVTVTALSNANSIIPTNISENTSIASSVVMLKE